MVSDASDSPGNNPPVRIDLHCHSAASTEADEAVLLAIKCPESYSDPCEVYAQAKQRGMRFVTITDHDSLEGVRQLARFDDVLSGEELTCYFPEDHCKIHLLLWGLSPADHDAVQAVADDIYAVAAEVARRRLAHAVAHPLYRQNDVLERWHLERLILLFKGFETLNGAHSAIHLESLQRMLDELTPRRIEELAARHGLTPLWNEPWIKSRTGGSDDHGLFNIGRTWTLFPADARTISDVLECLRTGRCEAGGEPGSSLKLAHNFYAVALRYYGDAMTPAGERWSTPDLIRLAMLGRPRPSRSRVVMAAAKRKLKSLGGWFTPRRRPAARGTSLLADLILRSIRQRLPEHACLRDALSRGSAPLGEHEAMFALAGDINRDMAAGLFDGIRSAISDGRFAGIFDTLSAALAQQFMLAPYYFSLFHQNRERNLLQRITGTGSPPARDRMRIAAFSDTLDEVNGVSRFVRDLAERADATGRSLTVHTCGGDSRHAVAWRKTFRPLLSCALPQYPELSLNLPPVLEVLQWADRQQFDAVHIHTPGPMGLCGLLVAKMLRVPVLGTYHTDFPAYVAKLTGDYRLSSATAAYMSWFYQTMATVLTRSRQYEGPLRALGIDGANLGMAHACVDSERFNPRYRAAAVWEEHRVTQPHKLLYVGRVSKEKNLPVLVSTFQRLCAQRQDVALVIAGDGPYRPEMEAALAGLPVHFLGYRNDHQLAPLYASSDLFVFPSRTDTLGQVVLEAQASGLPVIVSNEGGPQEVMDDQVTGVVVGSDQPEEWAAAIDRLLWDHQRRLRMARTAAQRMSRYSPQKAFEEFWDVHWRVVAPEAASGEPAMLAPRELLDPSTR